MKSLSRKSNVLATMGENIKLARLRRQLSAHLLCERANISRPTLTKIEQGSATVRIGSYVDVLFVLGMDEDLLQVAADDKLGRKLQDLMILPKKRAPKNRAISPGK